MPANNGLGVCVQCGCERAANAPGLNLCQPCAAAAEQVPEGVLLSIDIRFRCPFCAKKSAVDLGSQGGRVKCPRCQQAFRVPVVDTGFPAEPSDLLTEPEIEMLMTAAPGAG